MTTSPDDLGPLPKGDRQDTLQQLSLKALRNRLPEHQFLFRREGEDDKGVDGVLEVKIAAMPDCATEEKSRFTNCRAQAQLKSTDKPQQNKDGSVSYTIETSNLNYLLYGQSPLYFLWIAPDDEMRFAWARDEWHRLEKANQDWCKQETITVRFERVLTAETSSEIHARILTESRLTRSILESLARSAVSECVVIGIDPRTLKSSDPTEILGRLRSSGMTIVSAGYGQQVLASIDVLNPEARKEARIQLLTAYAHVSLGRYYEAAGNLSQAWMGRADLSPHDQQFLEHLRNACDLQTGRIDHKEFMRRERDWAQRQGGIQLAEHRLEELRQERIREKSRQRRAELLKEMGKVVAEIQAATDAVSPRKLQARIVLLSAEVEELCTQFIAGVFQIKVVDSLRFSSQLLRSSGAQAMGERMDRWNQQTTEIVNEALAVGHPLLVADARIARLAGAIALLESRQLIAIAAGDKSTFPVSAASGLQGEAEEAIRVYKQAGHIEGEVRVQLMVADLFEVTGRLPEAKAIAEHVLPIAEAMGYGMHQARARDFLEDQTLLQQFETRVTQGHAQDPDFLLANESDEGLRNFAGFMLESAGLPADRLPAIERDVFADRMISRERVNWCRSLQLPQETQQTGYPSTYRKRWCRCEKHKYESSIRHPDPDVVIAAFKRNYCEDCPDRHPKRK